MVGEIYRIVVIADFDHEKPWRYPRYQRSEFVERIELRESMSCEAWGAKVMHKDE